jgi:hypothetical protein
VQRLIGSSKGPGRIASYLPLAEYSESDAAGKGINVCIITPARLMSPTRGKVMARAYSTTSSSSTSGFSTDTEGQAQKAPRPVPFSPPKASLERDDFFRLYKVFCNLTGHDYQVCCTSNSNSNSPRAGCH